MPEWTMRDWGTFGALSRTVENESMDNLALFSYQVAMDISKTIATLKKEPGFHKKVGMILTHNGVVRATTRDGRPVTRIEVTPDFVKMEAIRAECEKLPGVFKILVEAHGGVLAPGDDLLFIVVAGDIRENVLEALTITLNRIKSEAVAKRETLAVP
jgi:molybdopterin synthase catalytic subunit